MRAALAVVSILALAGSASALSLATTPDPPAPGSPFEVAATPGAGAVADPAAARAILRACGGTEGAIRYCHPPVEMRWDAEAMRWSGRTAAGFGPGESVGLNVTIVAADGSRVHAPAGGDYVFVTVAEADSTPLGGWAALAALALALGWRRRR